MFSLLGFDSQEGGLHHGTARIACAIIAGNRWDGYLSLQPNGPRVPETDEDVLLSDKYYFLVPGRLSELHPPTASKGSMFVLILGHCRPLSLRSPGFQSSLRIRPFQTVFILCCPFASIPISSRPQFPPMAISALRYASDLAADCEPKQYYEPLYFRRCESAGPELPDDGICRRLRGRPSVPKKGDGLVSEQCNGSILCGKKDG